MAADNKQTPKSTSSDHDAMRPYWDTVSAILGGAPAMRRPAPGMMSVAGPAQPVAQLRQLTTRLGLFLNQSPFLPAYESESPSDYQRRRDHSPLTNIYADASANLASKPFTKECQLDESESPPGEDFKKIALDVDGQGNSLHVFSSTAFKRGIDYAIHWILVDYPKIEAGATLADERAVGARPYWVQVPAERVLAAYSVFFGSKEVFYHVRLYEPAVEQADFGEVCKERVRIFIRDVTRDSVGRVTMVGPPRFEVWEEQGDESEKVWNKVDEGGLVGVDRIPIVPFRTGEREGNSWKICPPMQDLALMQVEEFQQESGLKHIKELSAFPMLAGQGVKPKTTTGDDGATTDVIVPVGPGVTLFAPPDGSGNSGRWEWIAPPAETLTFLETSLEKLQTNMRNLGKQPLAEANLTVVTTANVSMKASSVVQAWAILFKDALDQAWDLTAQWMKRQKLAPEVYIFTDFGVEIEAGQELTSLLKAEDQRILSKEDVAEEFKRRGVLRDSFDWKKNAERRASDDEGVMPEENIDPITGQPIKAPTLVAAE